MTEEIKELLDILNKVKDYDDKRYFISCGENDYLLTNDEIKCLLNYITNLQKENEKLKETLQADRLMKAFMVEHNRNEKAVEYIKNDLQISVLPNNQIINGKEVVKRINKIVNILEGDDE